MVQTSVTLISVMSRITLVLHNIRSTYNVGSIFRTAEGFGVRQIILTGYTPYPTLGNHDERLPHEREKISAQIHKTALGAENLVPFAYHADPYEWLRSSKLPVVALEQDEKSIPLDTYMAPAELVLLLGEEVNGIPSELLATAQDIIEIPMMGRKESFNVSVATGIALYKLSR